MSRGCALLALLLEELGIKAVALHSHLTQGRRLAALHRCPILLTSILLLRFGACCDSWSIQVSGGSCCAPLI